MAAPRLLLLVLLVLLVLLQLVNAEVRARWMGGQGLFRGLTRIATTNGAC